jgi:hypothetical protein
MTIKFNQILIYIYTQLVLKGVLGVNKTANF